MATGRMLQDQNLELLRDPDSSESLRLYVSSYARSLPTLTALASSKKMKEIWLESPEVDEKVGLICRDILCRCTNLESLTLELTECSDDGMKEVAKVMSRKGSKLKRLCLRLNNVAEKGAGHLAQALLRSPIVDLEIIATQLDHHDKYIGDRGVALICDGATLTDGSCKLASLTVAQSRITSSSLPPLINLLQLKETLHKLDLNSNQLDSHACDILATQLSKENCHLTHLVLDSNSMIGDGGSAAIGHSLTTNNSLKSLSLRSCGITKEGARSVAMALKCNRTLVELFLDGNVEIGDDGLEHIADSLRGSNNGSGLELLDLSSCSVGDVGCAALAAALQENTTLKSLVLGKNNIGAAGVSALSHSLVTATQSLTSLVLTENRLDDSAAACLLHCLQHNSTLVHLELDTPSSSSTMGMVSERRQMLDVILAKNKQLYQCHVLVSKLRKENKQLHKELQNKAQREPA